MAKLDLIINIGKNSLLVNQLLLEQENDAFSKCWSIFTASHLWLVVLIGSNGNVSGSALEKVHLGQASEVISCGVLC